jgi:serine phosphatase RsbU (regulator of sigma subunit)
MTRLGRQQGWLLLAIPPALLVLLALVRAPNLSHTGLTLREDWVLSVAPQSPAARAGLAAGDLIEVPGPGPHAIRLREAMRTLEPGRPKALIVRRGTSVRSAVLIPEPAPPSTVRYVSMLAWLAAGFLALGVWVLERRGDRLGRVFFLLCWAFALVLCPLPRFPSLAWLVAYEALYPVVTLLLPALFIHFFTLFPQRESGSSPRPAGVTAAYAVSGLLGAASIALLVHSLSSPLPVRESSALLQAVSASYFALALLGALGLFARSYLKASSDDIRRRLRVVLIGTALGVAPVAAAVLLRNLAPHLYYPGDRWAPLALVLIPASFAYAIAVHNIFDFRVALRFSVTYLSLAALIGALYLLVRPWVARAFPDAPPAQLLTAVGFLVALASLAGPVRPWIQRLSERLVPPEEESPTAALLEALPAEPAGHSEEVVAGAARALQRGLRLAGCGALVFEPEGARWLGWWGNGVRPTPVFSAALHAALEARRQPTAVEELEGVELGVSDRAALDGIGATLLVPLVSADHVRGALVLGPRLSGGWLSPKERQALGAFARQASVALENAILHRADRRHGELQREMAAARTIQTHLLPQRAPVFATLDCAAVTHSCEQVGGDFYDFVETGPREFAFAVGDCAGKGVPAALLLATVQAGFRREAVTQASPGELLGRLNRQLAVHAQPERFVCLFCARFEVRAARLSYANAGLPPAQLRRADGSWCSLEESGLLLGVRTEAGYPESGLALGPGDLLVLATDGLTEARRDDELFGLSRLREVVDASAGLRAPRICDALIRAAREFTSDDRLDDLTIVVMRQLAPPAGNA